MNGMLVDSNVYYLPMTAAVDVLQEPEWPGLRTRLRNAWWRLRLALAEVRGILRRPRGLSPEDVAAFGEADTPRHRRHGRPARVISFEDARRRLRPEGRA